MAKIGGLSLLLLVATVGCGARTSFESTDPPDAGSDEYGRPLALPRPVCPNAVPEIGTRCTPNGIECSYGESLAFGCRRSLVCNGRWEVERTGECTVYPSTCPEEPSPGESCYARFWSYDPLCEYEAGIGCHCSSEWECYGPPDDPNCPTIPPNLGEGCAIEGLYCRYGDPCRHGHSLLCGHGAWEQRGYYCAALP